MAQHISEASRQDGRENSISGVYAPLLAVNLMADQIGHHALIAGLLVPL
ncbi:MAG: hypothetical protein ABSF96_04755 [Steroidobacteraceae bacterium]|jgi:hypothetical protein